MSTTLVSQDTGSELLERVVIGGDLSQLAAPERLRYYREVCASLGLNPLTKPFEYLHLNGKLVLYARRDATDQLRKLHGISIIITGREYLSTDVYVVTARASTKDGRTDESMGVVSVAGLKGEALANALMKSETKGKRRVTLSICGLGMLDETEVETIPAEDLKPLVPPAGPPPRPAGPPDVAAPPSAPAPALGPSAAPYDEWLEAFTRPDNQRALEALWRGCTAPDLWDTWSASQQVGLTAAKNAAKKRLGILT